MFRQGTRVVVCKLQTASAAQQSLSRFKITSRLSAAHLQHDDIDCRRALRAGQIYKRAHKPTTCPVAPSHVMTVCGARKESVLAELTLEENACSHGEKNFKKSFQVLYVSLLCVASSSDYPQCRSRKRFEHGEAEWGVCSKEEKLLVTNSSLHPANKPVSVSGNQEWNLVEPCDWVVRGGTPSP